jgi:Holliday junction resolvase RusA-like endonuclease
VTEFTLFVPGIPIPQGSARAFVVGGRAVITGANKKTKPWRGEIAAAAIDLRPEGFTDGAVSIALDFYMPRPLHLAKKYNRPTSKPDLDKLIRAVLDALTGVLWVDDSQVVEIVARKYYDLPTGVHITVTHLTGGKPR